MRVAEPIHNARKPDPPRISLTVWGVYLTAMGAMLIAASDALTSAFGYPPIQDQWIRILGALTLNVGLIYFPMAQAPSREFLAWCIYARLS